MDSHPVGEHEAGDYEIRLQGRLDQRWATWLDGMAVSTSTDTRGGVHTVLRGHVVDQAALHGLLTRLRDIGLPIVSITRSQRASTGDEHRAGERNDR